MSPRRPAALRSWRRYLNALTALGVSLLAGAGLLFVLSASMTSSAPAKAPGAHPAAPVSTTLTALNNALHGGAIRAATLDEAAQTISFTTASGARIVQVPAVYLHDAVTQFLTADVPLTVVHSVTSPAATSSARPGVLNPGGAQAAGQGGGNATAGLQALAFLLALAGAPVLVAGVRRGRRDARPALATPNAEPAGEPGETVTGGPRRKKAAAGPGAGDNAHLTVEVERPDTRFSDVAGCAEAVFDLTELVLFLQDPDRFTRLGATQPKGALLCGPPGTGKTLLARAVAGESGVPFYAVAGSDFVEKYVGVGPQRVRALFEAARKQEKAIIFIDEIDAIGVRRSGGDNRDPETEKTLLALLKEMDGFDRSSSVIIIAATNRPDILDPALVRPGRLDRRVEVPNPDARGRREILDVHVAGKPMAGDVDLDALALRTPGFSGAQLAALVNEACLDAVRRDEDEISQDALDHAVATIAMGRARTSAVVTDHDARVTAWHEAGHALSAYLQPEADDPVQVTIVPRGPAGGVTWMSGSDDIFLTRLKAHAQLVTALSGRVGEELLLDGEYTQGASGDLQSATELATRMATQYGMTRLGYQVRDSRGDDINGVVEELLAEAYETATGLLTRHRRLLEAMARELLARKTITLADIDALAIEHGVPRRATLPRPSLPLRPRSLVAAAITAEPRPTAAPRRGVLGRRRPELVAAAALLLSRRPRRDTPERPAATA
ncbi:MAG TPA: AAA family ATPase [Jatrophihabitans sp.]|uniref:ATP-dependent metallopeptidase FtsH/Yme1/Tma family protein n=1 Tax=Jatrophihabitans sp. TaxID=1932789 RepID=UPI002DFCF890|nr:AAA family ATPase [Jatrophihabitans sp.]